VRKSSVGGGGIWEKHVQILGGVCDGAGVKPGYTIGTIRPLCGICSESNFCAVRETHESCAR
jgi:hypothetical protein